MPIMCALAVAALVSVLTPAAAQDIHHHPGKSPAVDRFYSLWKMPRDRSRSCCDKTDCDEAEVRIINGQIWAKRARDAHWRMVPAQDVEIDQDSPDGRNHLCAPNESAHGVYCFVAGIGG